jgi:hypothetical protein
MSLFLVNLSSTTKIPKNEKESYLSSSNARHGTDILSYWKANQQKHSILAEMANQ